MYFFSKYTTKLLNISIKPLDYKMKCCILHDVWQIYFHQPSLKDNLIVSTDIASVYAQAEGKEPRLIP